MSNITLKSSPDRRWLATLLVNLAVAVSYLLVTSLMFVYKKQPDPIGIGTWQWVCIVIHLVLILLTYLMIGIFKKQPKGSRYLFPYALAGFIIPIIIYFALIEPIWDTLWSMRDL